MGDMLLSFFSKDYRRLEDRCYRLEKEYAYSLANSSDKSEKLYERITDLKKENESLKEKVDYYKSLYYDELQKRIELVDKIATERENENEN